MKSFSFKSFLVLIGLILTSCVYAQTTTASVDEMLKRRSAEKVGEMTDKIEFMANPQNDIQTRYVYKSKALKLFVNNGEAYEEDGRHKDGVYMEVTSVYRKKPSRRLMRDYFEGLINMRYSKVTIESTDVSNIKVSNLQKTDDGQYVCTCYFEQAFCGYKDGRLVYKDITRKKVKCYVSREETIDGVEYIVRLGDVTALETIKVK